MYQYDTHCKNATVKRIRIGCKVLQTNDLTSSVAFMSGRGEMVTRGS